MPAVGQAIATAGTSNMPVTGGQPVGGQPGGGPSSTGKPGGNPGDNLGQPGGTLRAGGGVTRGTPGMKNFANEVNTTVEVGAAGANGAGDGA
jgi:hypothetical protein